MPPCVVRGHHGGAEACATAFVVPEFIHIDFELFVERLFFAEQFLFVEFVDDLLHGLEIDFVVVQYGFVEFVEMAVRPGRRMTGKADVLHFLPFGLMVGLGGQWLELGRTDG